MKKPIIEKYYYCIYQYDNDNKYYLSYDLSNNYYEYVFDDLQEALDAAYDIYVPSWCKS